jgi:nitronate monooxygenase
MAETLPKIIQGGMGAGVSSWHLAKTVSCLGQLGVVSGTGLDQILARRLQDGDPGGEVRRALDRFPFPKMTERILRTHFVPGGKPPDAPYRSSGTHTLEGNRTAQEMCIAGNFVEVFLAKEGHENPVGINYLEKIQLPLLPSLYGAMLAGVGVVIMGAGIPIEVPGVLDALAAHQPATYGVRVVGARSGESYRVSFDPADFLEDPSAPPPIARPLFYPIVSSEVLVTMLLRRANGRIDGFVVEGHTAGGHNAPPRGSGTLSDNGQPVYGPRDVVDLASMRKTGRPFWLAGSYGSAEGLRAALEAGAAGVQVGTAFALCEESGFAPEIRQALLRKALAGEAEVFTDPVASPTGFPFKVAKLEGTLSDPEPYEKRLRVCNLGLLRELYLTGGGAVGYRCPAEPEAAWVAKGGAPEESVGRRCLCNALVANIGMPQPLAKGGRELPFVTLGDDFVNVERFCLAERPTYTAADVVRTLLG